RRADPGRGGDAATARVRRPLLAAEAAAERTPRPDVAGLAGGAALRHRLPAGVPPRLARRLEGAVAADPRVYGALAPAAPRRCRRPGGRGRCRRGPARVYAAAFRPGVGGVRPRCPERIAIPRRPP